MTTIWDKTIFLCNARPEDLATGFVYWWINTKTERQYIGGYCGKYWKYYTGSGKSFKAAFKEDGLQNFTRLIIHVGEDYKFIENLTLKMFDVAKDDRFYNILPSAFGIELKGEDHPRFGRTHTAEARAKIAAARTGQRHTAETRARMSAAKRGRTRPPFSEAWRAKLSAAHRARHQARKAAVANVSTLAVGAFA